MRGVVAEIAANPVVPFAEYVVGETVRAGFITSDVILIVSQS